MAGIVVVLLLPAEIAFIILADEHNNCTTHTTFGTVFAGIDAVILTIALAWLIFIGPKEIYKCVTAQKTFEGEKLLN